MGVKILHIINNLSKGGAERLLVNVLPHYRSKEIEVSVLQISDLYSEKQYINELEDNDINVSTLGKHSVYHPINILLLKKYLKKNRFDVVHVHLFPSMYWAGIVKKMMKTDTKFVFTEHSNENKRFNKSYFKYIDRFIYKEYDKIIAISPSIKQKLMDWTEMNDKISLIRNGVDTDSFKEAKAYEKNVFLQELGLPLHAKLILMTARFFYPKDHKTVVNALDYLSDDFFILFAGDAGDKKSVEDYVKEKSMTGRVIFLGFRNDIPKLMKTVDVNVLSSDYEGMSGVTCEALASGVPFIGSDVLGVNDVVPNSSYLFPAGDSKKLALQIQNIFENPKNSQESISKGLQWVNQFDINNMVNSHTELYRNLIRK